MDFALQTKSRENLFFFVLNNECSLSESMGKSKKKKTKAAVKLSSQQPTAQEPKKPSWESITLKKPSKSRPTGTAPGTSNNGGHNVPAETWSSSNVTENHGRGDSIVAVKSFKLPNFLGKIREVAKSIDPKSPPNPGEALKKVAGVYAHEPESCFSKESCKLMLKELGVFQPPRNYVTLGAYEIAWAKAVASNRSKRLTLAQFKSTLVPGIARATKPRPQTSEALWSRLCLNAGLLLQKMRPKQPKKLHKAPQAAGPGPQPAGIEAARPAQQGSFAARAKKAPKGKKMSLQEFQSLQRKQEQAETARKLAQARQRVTRPAPAGGAVTDSLRDIMEREARLQLRQEQQAQAQARAKSLSTQQQLHSKRLARRQHVWANAAPGKAQPNNLRAVMAREAMMQQKAAANRRAGFVQRQQQAPQRSRGTPNGAVSHKWGTPTGRPRRGQPTLREIQLQEEQQRQAASAASAAERLTKGASRVNDTWEFQDADAGDTFGDDLEEEPVPHTDSTWDGETERLYGGPSEHAREPADEKGFWDF